MLQIDRTVISLDILRTFFCCDLDDCKGACCVEGDSGAPLDAEELSLMIECVEQVMPYMTDAGKEVVRQQGVFSFDPDGDVVTTLVNGKECAFTVFEDGKAFCAIEKAFLEGKSTFRKPVSCHLYPVRITRYRDFDAVNYHRWEVCSGACSPDAKKKVPLYVFLREPLIRKFGEQWYEQLCYAATHLDV